MVIRRDTTKVQKAGSKTCQLRDCHSGVRTANILGTRTLDIYKGLRAITSAASFGSLSSTERQYHQEYSSSSCSVAKWDKPATRRLHEDLQMSWTVSE